MDEESAILSKPSLLRVNRREMDEQSAILVPRVVCSSSSDRPQHRNAEENEEEDALSSSSSSSSSSSDDSSPLGWPLGRRQRCSSFASSNAWDDGAKVTSSSSGSGSSSSSFAPCDEKQAKRQANVSEVELMKERFAKLLLGEDMSGGSKGVCTALAISNAITNLAASVFGELWRLEPLSTERKAMWGREMEWLLSVSDYIVELVPSWQSFRDGSNMEIMVSRPRSDIQINLPALRKLDTMLLESLDSYKETEFWYVDQGIVLAEPHSSGGDSHTRKHVFQRQEEKWWLPTPRVPPNGLSAAARKSLQNQRDCTNQILKAAMAINGQVLSEMEVPDLFWENLPKNGKSCLGETMYRGLTSENFSAEFMLEQLDLSSEHSAIEAVNRVEAAIHIWQRKLQHHQHQQQLLLKDQGRNNAKSSWGKVKDHLVAEIDRSTLIERAESVLHSLKQRHPGLPQTALDMYKIQYNRDVGQSILESYSRVLESLAFNILARIDDVMFIDDSTKEQQEQKFHKQLTPPSSARVPSGLVRRLMGLPPMHPHGHQHSRMANSTPYATPFASPNRSPDTSPTTAVLECFQQLHCGRDLKTIAEEASPPSFSSSVVVQPAKKPSYARTLESSRKLASPPARD